MSKNKLNMFQRWAAKIAGNFLNKKFNKMSKTKSPNTTIAAIGIILVAIGAALKAWFDGDPSTTVDFNMIIMEIVAFITAIGLFKSKDANATHSGNATD